MWTLGHLALWIAFQLGVGGLVLGTACGLLLCRRGFVRRRRLRLGETARSSCIAAAAALPAAALLLSALRAVGQVPPLPHGPGGSWAPTLLGGLCACGCFLILGAGRSESRGRRRRAARRVYGAGGLLCLASLAYAGVLYRASVLAGGPAGDDGLPWPGSLALLRVSAGTLVLAGLVGLMAGLSRKPRPSGTFAVLLYAASQWAWLLALGS